MSLENKFVRKAVVRWYPIPPEFITEETPYKKVGMRELGLAELRQIDAQAEGNATSKTSLASERAFFGYDGEALQGAEAAKAWAGMAPQLRSLCEVAYARIHYATEAQVTVFFDEVETEYRSA